MLAFITFIPGAVLNSNLNIGPFESTYDDVNNAIGVSRTGTGWIITVCWAVIVGQLISILLRFLNLSIMERYVGFFLIAVSLG